MATYGTSLRRGLPRTAGADGWPPQDARAAAVVALAAVAPQLSGESVQEPQEAAARPAIRQETSPEAAPYEHAGEPGGLRRGLPRVAGGEPWPPASAVRRVASVAVSRADGPQEATPEDTVIEQVAISAVLADRPPLTFPRTVWPGAAARRFEQERRAGVQVTVPQPKRYGPFTKLQWGGAIIVGGAGLLFAAGMIVVFTRWFISLEFMQEFLVAYPGEYHLPEGAPVGIPPWLGWQHFFNVFLMVLIIRSGLQVRTDKRPSVFWSPRANSGGKISLNLWFHQSLDILWIVNGVIFVVLLFATGQWMKIVPTSWSVFPNAVSAGLQYVSLDWPTENGWVNYNSLQQLAYFATVFLAAPLAIATGVRMSGIWPKNATRLNRAYPVEWARAVHFPVMIYFVLFIIAHVTLVFATGALRNLNHMYASQDVVNWAGFWIFVASLIVIAAGWVAARPLVLAPIAKLFGNVTGR